MRPVRGTIALAAGAVSLALAAEGCLLAYDFDDYGSGGSSSASSSSSAASSGAGGSAERPTCTAGAVRFTTLLPTWTEVLVAQLGAGFIAAPRDVLAYTVLAEAQEPVLHDRQEGTEGLLGLFALDVDNVARSMGVRARGADLKLKGFDIGGDSDSIPDSTFSSVQQLTGEAAAVLVVSHVEAEAGSFSAATIVIPSWDPDNARPYPGLLFGDAGFVSFCVEGACEFRNAALLGGGGPFAAAVAGNGLSDDAVVNETFVGRGAFVVLIAENDEGSIDAQVIPLSSVLDVAFEVSAQLDYASGIRGDRNAKVELFVAEPEVLLAGEARVADPSRFAHRHWMTTEWTGDRPAVVVYRVDGDDSPVFSLPGARGLDVATAPRTDEQIEGILVSAIIGASDVIVGDCTLPAGAAVLAEVDVAVAP